MNEIAIDNKFSGGWVDRLGGTGAVSVTNGILNCYGPDIDDEAMKDLYFPVQGGEIIEFECFARAISGEPRIAIDLISATSDDFTLNNYVTMESSDFKKYTLRSVVPENTSYEYIRVVLGKWGGTKISSEGEYFSPVFKIGNGPTGSNLVLAKGLIKFSAGPSPELHSSFMNMGVQSLAYVGASKTIVVTLDKGIKNELKPLVFVSTDTSPSDGNHTTAIAGAISAGANGTFFIMLHRNGTRIEPTINDFIFFQVIY